MRRLLVVLLAAVSLAGCAETPKEHQESVAQKEYFECKNGIETPHCTEQKNIEAREKEDEHVKEIAREAERLQSEGR